MIMRKHMFEEEVMMKNKFKKNLLEDFENSYQCNVTPESVIEKSNFFKNKNFIYISTPFYKKEFISSLISIALILVIGITLTISNNKLLSTVQKINDYNETINKEGSIYSLTKDDMAYMETKIDKVLTEFVFSVSLDSYLDLVIYKGYNYEDFCKSENVYFYKIVKRREFNESKKYQLDLTIICNNLTEQINENNKLGILYIAPIKYDSESIDNIIVTVINHNVTSKYEINILNSL